MEIEGEVQIAAAPATVWQRLNDARFLERCIPGCTTMTQLGEHTYECAILAKYGPVKATFTTTLEVSNIKAPESYTLTGRGQGGAAGFGEGCADVVLLPMAEGTCLRYAARINAGGKIAQVGARLLSSTTRKLTAQFFTAFAAGLGGVAPSAGAPEA